jgi:predicted rRNA methylase YqxC with S4 and FtsJ domains
MCQISDYEVLDLDTVHWGYVKTELDLWHRYYLPAGETVLDLGAGCGETVFFYLSHGAKHVIAIEADNLCVEKLRKNYGEDSRVTIIHQRVDKFKIDIDGAEVGSMIETHGAQIFPVYTGGPNLWAIANR